MTEPTSSEPRTRRWLLTALATGAGLAVAGCQTDDAEPTATPVEATVTIHLRNADDEPREYRVVVRQGDSVTNEFSGIVPPSEDQAVEMIATLRARHDTQYEFAIRTSGGQQGRTWDPTECPDFVVDATIENGTPGFESRCRSS